MFHLILRCLNPDIAKDVDKVLSPLGGKRIDDLEYHMESCNTVQLFNDLKALCKGRAGYRFYIFDSTTGHSAAFPTDFDIRCKRAKGERGRPDLSEIKAIIDPPQAAN